MHKYTRGVPFEDLYKNNKRWERRTQNVPSNYCIIFRQNGKLLEDIQCEHHIRYVCDELEQRKIEFEVKNISRKNVLAKYTTAKGLEFFNDVFKAKYYKSSSRDAPP
jgi:hypothetical protein